MWITQAASFIKDKFNMARAALPMIPPILLICESAQRPGLSAIALATAIIQRLPEAGIETGVNACGAPNMVEQLVRIACEEFVKEYKENSVSYMGLPTGSVSVTGVGPVPFNGTNLLPVSFKGVNF